MGGKSAVGAVASAGIYAAARTIDSIGAWVQALAVASLQVAAMKKLLSLQKDAYDDIASKQIGYVETAVNQYLLSLNNDLLPTFKDAFPDVPQAAPYTLVNTEKVVFDQMVENIRNLPQTEEYITRVGYLQRTNFIARLALLSPGFLQNLQYTSYQIRDLLEGKLSVGDIVEITTDSAELAQITGRIGAGGKTTLRNLGISRMRAQAAGRAALVDHLRMINQDISPLGTEPTLDQQMINPANRLALAIQETQLMQNSLQNIYNTAAQKPPTRLAELQAKLQAAIARLTWSANKGNMTNQFVPNYAAVFGPSLQSLTSSIGNLISDKQSTWQHPAGTEQGGTLGPGVFG